MGNRFTKFKSNYLMRSQHQRTDFGTLMERDWVTTNGLNVLRFGSGRKVWYNSGNFVYTTANIPSYHKKHRLSTETDEWKWNDCNTADSTVNMVTPLFNTTDLRDYAYYGSCVELVRSTIEDIISDFPGRLKTDGNTPCVSGNYTNNLGITIDILNSIKASNWDVSYDAVNKKFLCYKDGVWNELNEKGKEDELLEDKGDDNIGVPYLIKSRSKIMALGKKETKYFIYSITPTNKFSPYYSYDVNNGQLNVYTYSYTENKFNVSSSDGLVSGKALTNQFQIDLHHNRVSLGKYDNPMRFMTTSWNKYCIKKSIGETDELVGKITSYSILEQEELPCKNDNEGKILKIIEIITDNDEIGQIVIYCYCINGSISYAYEGEGNISIEPQKEYIDGYFNSLTGFKKQLLRQDTKPLYMNKFITPTEYEFIWYYPEKFYTWPSNGYCIDIDSMAFSSFVGNLYDAAQKFDDMWSDNLYRSMTHEAIKNFDWSYSREYYEGDEQDNIEGGERMKKIIRVFGRVFDDVKVYMDTLKLTSNISYDANNNGPEALLSDNCELHGFDVKSTIGAKYDTDSSITSNFLNSDIIGKKDNTNLKKWYQTRNSETIYPDVCDNEFMRRLSLSSKRIMQTKGTQNAIEMVFGLFGLGKGDDYLIEEEAYYTESLIRSDECVNGKETNGEDWTTDNKINWTDVKSRKKGDLAIEINAAKDLDTLYYDDQLSGIPMREVYLGRKRNSYLVPYYDSAQLYDGDLIFQGKGGWGKMISSDNDNSLNSHFEYQETLSYLHVVGDISELLAINPYTIENNDIYYVVRLDDYSEYDENPPISEETDITMSHYFMVADYTNPQKIGSWRNILVKDTLDKKGNLQLVDNEDDFNSLDSGWDYKPTEDMADDDKLGTYTYAFRKMRYLESIVSTNIGNNPHVGYGNYDDGSTYLEYMKLPFKYLIDNDSISDFNLKQLAEKFRFEIKGGITDKIQIMDSIGGTSDFVKYTANDDSLTIEYGNKEDNPNNTEKRWYINTKSLTITNKHEDSDLFKDYLKSVIMPYVMQVIPSTTILKLKNFS